MRRRAAWLREHPLCMYCLDKTPQRVVTPAVEVDHRIPLWKGGADDESNYASACRECHALKTEAEARERRI